MQCGGSEVSLSLTSSMRNDSIFFRVQNRVFTLRSAFWSQSRSHCHINSHWKLLSRALKDKLLCVEIEKLKMEIEMRWLWFLALSLMSDIFTPQKYCVTLSKIKQNSTWSKFKIFSVKLLNFYWSRLWICKAWTLLNSVLTSWMVF